MLQIFLLGPWFSFKIQKHFEISCHIESYGTYTVKLKIVREIF